MKDDLTYLKQVLDSIELFPSEILEHITAEPHYKEAWLAATENGQSISINYPIPESWQEY